VSSVAVLEAELTSRIASLAATSTIKLGPYSFDKRLD